MFWGIVAGVLVCRVTQGEEELMVNRWVWIMLFETECADSHRDPVKTWKDYRLKKKKQGKLGAKGSAGKDGVKVQKGSRIPISLLIYHQYAKWTSTKNNGNCSKDKTKLQCFSHTLLLFYLQGEIGLPGLSLPGQKGEPVRKNHRDRVFVWIELTFFHLCPSKGRVWLVPAVRGWQRTCQHQNTRGSERQPRRTGPSGQPRTSGSWSGRQTGANNNDSAQAK